MPEAHRSYEQGLEQDLPPEPLGGISIVNTVAASSLQTVRVKILLFKPLCMRNVFTAALENLRVCLYIPRKIKGEKSKV